MNEVTLKLYEHCWQCGGEVKLDTAGDAYCTGCDAEAHYGYYYPDPDEKPSLSKPWTPTWLVREVERLKQIEDVALRIRNEIHWQGGWDRTFEEHSGGALADFDKLEPRQ